MFFEIFSDVHTPCLHNTAEDFYINLESILVKKGLPSVKREMKFNHLLDTLIAIVPRHRATEYLERYYAASNYNTIDIVAHQFNAIKGERGLSLIVPTTRVTLSLVDMRFTPTSSFSALGEIRVGTGMSNSVDEFDIAGVEDYAFGRSLFSILDYHSGHQFK